MLSCQSRICFMSHCCSELQLDKYSALITVGAIVQSSDFLVIANLLCLFLHQFCDVVGENYERREGLKANKHAWTIWQGLRVKTMVGIVYIRCGSSSLIPLLPYQTSGPGLCSVLYEPYLTAYVEILHRFHMCGLCCQLLFTLKHSKQFVAQARTLALKVVVESWCNGSICSSAEVQLQQ